MAAEGSDLTLNAAAFRPENASNELTKIRLGIEKMMPSAPRMVEVGIPRYREMLESGEVGLPPPVYLPEAVDSTIPSRDKDRAISVRILRPDDGQPSKGVLLFMHGGGWTIGSHRSHDSMIKRYANESQVTVVSVGYRLSPEHPYPAAFHDCCDAAEYLVDHGEEKFGAPLVAIGGGSSGAHLTVLAAFNLIRTRPSHRLAGLFLNYGVYELAAGLPSLTTKMKQLGASKEPLLDYTRIFVPGATEEEKRDPLISPIYDDMRGLARASPGGTLPPALFICGSEDYLIDDTVLMGAKWLATGSPAEIKIIPGAWHAFDLVPGLKETDDTFAHIASFLTRNMESLRAGN